MIVQFLSCECTRGDEDKPPWLTDSQTSSNTIHQVLDKTFKAWPVVLGLRLEIQKDRIRLNILLQMGQTEPSRDDKCVWDIVL